MWLCQCESLFPLKLGRKKSAAELSGEGLGELMTFCVSGSKHKSNPAEVLHLSMGSHVWFVPANFARMVTRRKQ